MFWVFRIRNDGSITPYTTNQPWFFEWLTTDISQDNNGQPEDDSGHGTHNAGIIAAQVNNLGVAGHAGIMWATHGHEIFIKFYKASFWGFEDTCSFDLFEYFWDLLVKILASPIWNEMWHFDLGVVRILLSWYMGKHMDITLAHVRWLNSGGAAGRNQMVKLMIVKVHCSTWSFRPSWGVLWETYIGRKPTSLEHRHVFFRGWTFRNQLYSLFSGIHGILMNQTLSVIHGISLSPKPDGFSRGTHCQWWLQKWCHQRALAVVSSQPQQWTGCFFEIYLSVLDFFWPYLFLFFCHVCNYVILITWFQHYVM